MSVDLAIDKLKKSDLDVGKAMLLRSKGATYSDIAKVMGVTKQAIHQRLSRFRDVIDVAGDVLAFEEHEAMVQSYAKMKLILHAVDDERLKKLTSRDAIISYGVIFDKHRIKTEQSTEIISVSASISQLADRLDKSKDNLEALEAQYQVLESQEDQ